MFDFDSINFFSKSVPNLVLKKTLKKLQKDLNQSIPQVGGVDSLLLSFYSNYIESNIFVISLFVIFILFLIYKYFAKNNNIENEDLIQDNFIPTFNPSSEIELQNSYNNYLPDDIPLNINNELVSYNNLNNVDENNIHKPTYVPHTNYIQNRDSYVGLHNPYINSMDFSNPHPYGSNWNTNFDNSTQSAIEFATELNNLSLQQSHLNFIPQNDYRY